MQAVVRNAGDKASKANTNLTSAIRYSPFITTTRVSVVTTMAILGLIWRQRVKIRHVSCPTFYLRALPPGIVI